EPFKMSNFKDAMARGGTDRAVKAGGNLMCINPFKSPTPGAPINNSFTQSLEDHYFKNPVDRCPKVTRVGAWGNPPKLKEKGWMPFMSPEEMRHALLLRIGEDVDANDEEALATWKTCLLSASMEFVYVAKEDDIWLKSANQREEYGADFNAMYRTGPKRAIEIAALKAAYEKSNGGVAIEADKVHQLYVKEVTFATVVVPGTTHEKPQFTAGYVDTALTVYSRILTDPVARDLVLAADEERGQASPHNSIYRLELFTKKAGQGNDSALHWLLAAVNDMVRNKTVDGAELSERGLSGKTKGGNGKGLLDLLLFKMHVLVHLLGEHLDASGTHSDGKVAVRNALRDHSAYRTHFGGKVAGGQSAQDLSWCGALKPSAQLYVKLVEDIIYSQTYDNILKQALKDSKGVEEALQHQTLKGQFDEIDTCVADEATPAASAAPAPIPTDIDEELRFEIVIGCVGADAIGTEDADESRAKLHTALSAGDKDQLATIRKFEEEAKIYVSKYIKLIALPKTEEELANQMRDWWVESL
ncbi:unnamed protein product, partial [Prorocentrum cordatum]